MDKDVGEIKRSGSAMCVVPRLELSEPLRSI